MSSCEQDLSEGGLGQIQLQNRDLRVSILPAAGGKISALTDLGSGRNWLWSNPYIPFSRGQYDVDYGRFLDSGGWDEILLSMSPADIRQPGGANCRIPDHGDLVGQVWTVTRAIVEPNGDAVCELSVQGRARKYRLKRSIRLRGTSACIEIGYSLTNQDNCRWPWYWCAHALLNVTPNMHIALPAGQDFRMERVGTGINGVQNAGRRWPTLDLGEGRSLDLSRGFETGVAADNFVAKLFVRSPETRSVKVVIPGTNESLVLRYAPETLPWLGLWINNSGWSGNGCKPYRNLGLEPATTPYDDVTEAMANDAVSWIEPGETRCWSLTVELRS